MRKQMIVPTLCSLLALALATAVQAQSFFNAVTNLHPVGYWPLNETTAPPASKPAAINAGTLGAADNGTYTDGAIPGVAGSLAGDAEGGCLFSGATGVNPRMAAPYDPAYANVTTFTLEAWVNSAVTDPAEVCPVNCLDTASPSAGWLIFLDPTGAGQINLRIYAGNGTSTSLNYVMTVPGGHILSNTWYHVVVSFNGTTAQGYINGQAQAVSASATGYLPSTAGPFTLGARSDNSFPFQGYLDEVALYSNVLSALDVLAHYQAGTNIAPATSYNTLVTNDHPLLYYRLGDGGPAPAAKNFGSLGAFGNGYYESGTTPRAAGPSFPGLGLNNFACAFGGSQSTDIGPSVPVVGMAGLPLGISNSPSTLAAWVQVPTSVSYFQTVAGKADQMYRFDVDNPGGLPHWNAGTSADLIGAQALKDGNWHYWVGVWDGTSQYLYIDGALVGQDTPTPGTGGNSQPFEIGTAPDDSGRNFVGSICQVAVFDKALSSAQIQGVYFSAGTPPVITAQPEPTVSIVGSNVSLTVSAIGTQPLTYQWYRGPVGSATPITEGNVSGATSPALTFTPAQTANDGTYYVVVTDHNGLTTTSAAGSLNVITTPLSGSYFPAVINLNPLSYWPLNETVQPAPSALAINGGTLGSAGNAVYSAGGISYQQPGALTDGDTAITGDGTSDSVILPYRSALATVPLTLEGWFNPTFNAAEITVGNGQGASPRTGLWIYSGINGTDLNLRTYQNSGTTIAATIDATGLTAGQWYYVAATVAPNPGSNSVATGYITTFYTNGVIVGSPVISAFVPNANAPFTIGTRSDGGYNFVGGMDEVAFYPSALDAATILAHYQAGTTGTPAYKALVLASHPLLYYRLNEPAYTAPPITSDPLAHNYGALGADDNGYYLPGCFPGAAAGPGFPGFSNQVACSFTNVYGGYVDIPTDPNNALNVQGPVTLTAWIQGSPADVTRFQSMAGKGDTSYRFGMDAGGAHFADGNGNPDVVGGSVNDGAWHFLAGTWDGSAEKIYIDGVLSATASASSAIPGNTSDFIIGGAPDYLPGRIFNGNVSQMAVFGQALTAAQIQALYNSAQVPPYIITEPATATFAINTVGTVSVTASGTPALGYQWYKGTSPLNNSGDLSGVNTATLTISPTALADSGNYQVVITNAYGAVTSTVAAVTIVSGPIIVPDLPATNHVYAGTTAILTVGLSGTAPFANAWTFNGHVLANGGRVSGAQSPTLTIANAQASDAGSYQFWSTNSLGTSHSSVGQLVVENVLGFNGNGSGWTLNTGTGSGSSPFFAGNNRLQLTTSGAGSQNNSFFFNVPLYIGAFKAHFTYWDLNDNADGVCFVIQNSAMGVNAVGDSGGGMGVRGITNSVEVEIDLYNEAFAYDTGGLTHEAAGVWPAGNAEFQMLGTGDDVGAPGQTKDMTLLYDGSVLTMTWSNETSQASATTNLDVGDITQAVGTNNTAYVGFTGACGGLNDTQIVGDFSFIPFPPAVSIATDGSGGVLITWPAVSRYALQKNSSLTNPAGWTTIAGPYTTVSGPLYDKYRVHVTPATGVEFYRLLVGP
jgi:hypothetical protein